MKNHTLTVVKITKSIGALFFLIAVCVGGVFAQPDEKSIAKITELIAARPDNDNMYIQRGNIYLYLNKLAEALADAEKAFELNPKNSDVFLLRGRVKSQQQDNDGAIADISRAIRASPTGYPLAYLMRGELYEKKGDLPRAYADFVKLRELTLNPKAPQGVARLESRMKAAGIDPAAPISVEPKVENKEARAAFQMADKFIKKLEWQAAIKEYGKAIVLDPEFAAAYANRARLYGNNSEFDLAIADYAAAIRLKPDYAEAFESRGGLYYIFNKPALALADFTEAIRLVPNSADAYLNRGRVYSTLNQSGKSAADWEKFLQLTPNSPNAELVRSYLANIRQSTSTASAANAAPSGNSNVSQPAGGIVNMTTDQWIESFKWKASLNGQTIVAEGTADKLLPYKKNSFNQLTVDVMNKHFVLLVFTDDPTYDSFFFIDGNIVLNPFFEEGYYISAPKITRLLNNQYINAVTLGSNNIARKISVEFRADKPGKVRYILFVVKNEQYAQ